MEENMNEYFGEESDQESAASNLSGSASPDESNASESGSLSPAGDSEVEDNFDNIKADDQVRNLSNDSPSSSHSIQGDMTELVNSPSQELTEEPTNSEFMSRSPSKSPSVSLSHSESQSRSGSPLGSPVSDYRSSRSRSRSQSGSRSGSAHSSGSNDSRGSHHSRSPSLDSNRSIGSDGSSSPTPAVTGDQSAMAEDLFGDAADISSSEGEPEQIENLEEGQEGQEEEQEEIPETQIEVEIPKINTKLGRSIHFVKLPNFLSLDTRPFDPLTYEDEVDEDDILDEEGRTRMKLKVENTMRWRNAKDEDGAEIRDEFNNPVRESNSRIVKWSDGSMSLHLGEEIFDVHTMQLQGDYNHLFIRQGRGLQGQSVFKTKLTFRPHSTDSFTHRKMTMSLADRSRKKQKIRVIPISGQDPDAKRSEMIKKEEERLRASIRRDNQRRRVREKAHSKGPTTNYLEDDDDDEEMASIRALKKAAKVRGHASRRESAGIYTDSESDLSSTEGRKHNKRDSNDSDSDAGRGRKKKKAKIVETDDESGDDADHAESSAENSDSGSGSGSSRSVSGSSFSSGSAPGSDSD